MKHVGLNVAAGPLMTLSYVGTVGGLVACVADDPGMHSSQNEQDTRHYARFAKVPIPLWARGMRVALEERMAPLRAAVSSSPANRIERGDRSLGIIAEGIAYQPGIDARGRKECL